MLLIVPLALLVVSPLVAACAGPDLEAMVDGGSHEGVVAVDDGAVIDAGEAPAPEGWTCSARWYGEGWCDCGCGLLDPDCANGDLHTCMFNACRGDMRPDAFDPLRCEVNYFTCNPEQIWAWQLARRHPVPLPREEEKAPPL